MKAIVIATLCSMLTLVHAQAQRLSRIQVKGNSFVNEKGDIIIFRGLNTSDPFKLYHDGQWTKRYLEEIKKWGANVVRFPVHPHNWRTMGKVEYLKLLDLGVQWATELDLYVIIDWHSIGNLRSELFQRPSYETTKKETFEFWQAIAEQYKDNTTVAFLELFNEPTVYNGKLGSSTWAEWKAINEEMITIIRANGSNAIPLVAGFDWAYDLTEAGANPIEAEGIAYVSHPYPQKRPKPWNDQWTKDWGFMAEKYPLILTEIGFCGPDDKGAHIPVISDESYGDAITAYCAEKGISYVVWVFDPQWSPMLIEDWNFKPTRQGKYFMKALQAGKK
jgi:endoglucanase